MGSACSSEAAPVANAGGTKTSPAPQTKKSHSIKHGNSIRVNDHEADSHMEENLCASLTNKKFLEKYELVQPTPLGKGAFASVYWVRDVKTKEDWAMKVVDKNHLSLEDGELQAIRWEAEAQMLCHEPGVVELRESFEVSDGGDLDKGFIYMAMEMCKGGELFDRIMEKSCYTELDAILVVRSIAKALANCHVHSVVHLDLKPENVLYVDKEGEPDGESVKLCDFGISRTMDPDHPAGGELTADGHCAPDGRLHGTPGYIAPEMINQEPFDGKCDVWQLGVMAYILISGIPPFEEPQHLEGTPEGMEAMFEYIKAGDYFPFDEYQPMGKEANPWEVCSKDARDFVKKCLIPSTKDRPSMKELLVHPWIANDTTRVAAAREKVINPTKTRLRKMMMRAKLQKGIRHCIIVNRLNKAATAFAAKPANMKYSEMQAAAATN